MKLSIRTALVALSVTERALAHSGLSNFYVNGKNQGDSVCVRLHTNNTLWNAPIENLDSDDMACGRDGTIGAKRVCAVSDGDTITFEYRQDARKPNDIVVNQNHVGPCTVYAKKVDSAITDKGAGDGWFKLWHEGYDEKAGQWCTDKLIASGGRMSVPLPKGLVGGNYLLRSEFLALHQAYPQQGDPQYYIGCAQVFLQSSGNLVPVSTVSIPGIVTKSDPSDSFNVYDKPMKLPYIIPGPALATFKAGTASSQTTQTEGLKPPGCIDEVGSNFCGTEVADYTTQSDCWKSATACWAQADICWKGTPATGYEGCTAWQTKCQGIQDDCNGSRSGPQNKGKDITPEKKDITPPPPLGGTAATGGSVSTPSTPKDNSSAKPVSSAAAVVSPVVKAPVDSYPASSAAAVVPSVVVKLPVSEYIPPLSSATPSSVHKPVSEYIPPLSAAPSGLASDSTITTIVTRYRTATVDGLTAPSAVAEAAGGSCGGVGRHRRVKHNYE